MTANHPSSYSTRDQTLAAWLIWREGGWKKQRRAMGLFLAQLVLNALWTPLFFGLHAPARIVDGSLFSRVFDGVFRRG